MTNTSRLLLAMVVAFAALAAACENPFDTSCPEGYWRPRAMEDCELLPLPDAGRDSGATPDAGSDAGATEDAGTDAGTAMDASADAATPDDAGADAALDASQPDGGTDGG